MPARVIALLLLLQGLVTCNSSLAQDRNESAKQASERHQRVAERRSGIHTVCHRGAVEYAHENTMEAYRAAFELGADGNEIDIRMTKEGVLVCFHDDMLDHLLEAYGTVADYTWEDLQKIPFRNPGRFGKYCRIPTLREVFELHREQAGLMHLDVKREGLGESISKLLEEMDMWDHVVQAHYKDPRIQNTPGLASMYLGHSDVVGTDIASIVKASGGRIILEYPQRVAKALGRTVAVPSKKPVRDEIAIWSTSLLHQKTEKRSVEELLHVLRDASDWNVLATGKDAEARSAEMILRRTIAADELARRGVRTPEVFAALEERVRNRTLHRYWQHCGLDGIAALRALIALKAPQSVELGRFCIWRDDPAVDAVQNPEFKSPRSWNDWRTKMIVFSLLESIPGEATEKLCRDYLALSDAKAATIGPPLFESAAKTLLAQRPEEATVNELLQHRRQVVRGRAILFCLANKDKEWAKRIADGFVPK